MDGTFGAMTFGIGTPALDRLMPMHLCLSPEGEVLHTGPTLAKLASALPGRSFFDVFSIRRPAGIDDMTALRRTGSRLYLRLRQAPGTGFRGLATPLSDAGAVLVNLSFGIDLAEAVREHRLSDADFAATDLAVELLYVVEAKSAVTDELRDLNRRLQSAKAAAEHQALTDTLTGLRNRRAMDRVMVDLVARGRAFGVMHVDLDYFKQVNDTLGHAAGDHVLQRVAQVLNDETREGDTVARVGGDEFVIVFPGLVHPGRMTRIAERIIARLGQPIVFEGRTCRVSASIGMTVSTRYRDPQPDRILSDADRALYASKAAGRARAIMAGMIG